jgi:DinB superfamily
MQVRDLLLDAFGRIDEEMRMCLDGLTADQLAFRPREQANSIAWLAWHLTRVEDDHVSDLAGREQAWIVDNWHARFDRPADAHDTGFGATAEQVAAIRPASASVLLEYFAAVHQRSLDFLRGIEPADLDRELDEPQWNPPVTAGVRLVSVIADCLQHVGQMAYIRGLIEDRHWLPY